MLAFEDPRQQRKKPAKTPTGGESGKGALADFSASYIKPESESDILIQKSDKGENQITNNKGKLQSYVTPGFGVKDEEESSSINHVSAFNDLSRDIAM